MVTLFTPDDVSTVLVGGETYSPPGLWSGTPLHVHDKNDLANGQSDHEEVYYHLARVNDGPWGAFGVQLLFDDQGLDNAYMIHNRDAFAIPGAAHPVVAGPNSDMLYVWALAFRENHPSVTQAQFERYRQLLRRHARQPLPWGKRLRYQLGRLLCGRRPFAPFLEQDRWETECLNSR